MSVPDKKQELIRMKRLAGILLIVVTAVFILAKLQHGLGVWAWVAAFAEAAMIGAMADWFAVVALFKHPLGLPIPHTAVIPRNKVRIADNLAVFVRDKFLGTEIIVEKIRDFDPARKIAGWLNTGNNAEQLADEIIPLLINGLDFLEDARVQAALREALHKNLKDLDLGQSIGSFLTILTEGNRHQLLLDEALRKIATVLDDPVSQKNLADMIVEVSGREYPSLMQMLGMMTNTDEFSLKIAGSLVASVNRWLHEVGDDPEHPRRKQFDEVVFSFMERVKHDQQFHDKINQWKMQLLESAEAERYISGFWLQMKQWLKNDLNREESSLRLKIIHGARNLGSFLDQHPALQESVNQHMAEAARTMAGQLRETIAMHISTTVKQWNDKELIEELELSVGSDLQYIRLNGTLVGGLIGLILHAVVTLF